MNQFQQQLNQVTTIDYYKVICTNPICGRVFFEFDSLTRCPHCDSEIDPFNESLNLKVTLKMDTRTGSMTLIKSIAGFEGD
ncbi:hypothetical protein GPJ61_27820 [Brevibacillus formosus]|uniref:hypothetical protein n=1 Tax=Brevibacillus formosus TaxID=54913 RepID=UPI001CA4B8BA|nr:hypothetical protein [Brevibacillus formosus]MBW5471599.1 hypothetical protein [Brevibacillus formosus]